MIIPKKNKHNTLINEGNKISFNRNGNLFSKPAMKNLISEVKLV